MYPIRIIAAYIIIYLFVFQSNAQESKLNYSIDFDAVIATESTLPFWFTANKFGRLPNNAISAVNSSIYSSPTKFDSPVRFAYKAGVTGYLAEANATVFVDELYGNISYKLWQLDVGIKHNAVLWEGLSSSNGTISKSTNSRSIPGYNFQLTDYVGLPFVKEWLLVKANYGDYLLNDTRSVDNARLHQKSIFVKIKFSEKVVLVSGLNHYVQWAGKSEKYGKQPSSFKDYIRVITGRSGAGNAVQSDQINVLGNQLGSYLVQVNFKGNKNYWNLYWSHPFEDGSGMNLYNFPDALYGFFIDLKKEKALISHILAEFTYTKHQSGSSPHYTDEYGVAHAAMGRDNYFNNGIYQSGWTYFGNTIGSPYFTTNPTNDEGITSGVIKGDNRFMAFNIGVKGVIKNVKYKTILSHTTYFGWFDQEYHIKPYQVSGLLEVYFPQVLKLPIAVTIGSAFDTGTYRPVNFGGFVRLSKRGVF